MSTLGAGKSGLLKAKRESIALRDKEVRARLLKEQNSSEQEKLEYEIAKYENIVKVSQYDLSNPAFFGNKLIEHKLEFAKEHLVKLKLKQTEFKNDGNKNNK